MKKAVRKTEWTCPIAWLVGARTAELVVATNLDTALNHTLCKRARFVQ